MTLPGVDRRWETGTHVLVLHHDADDRPARVGTLAVVEGADHLDEDHTMYTLVGRALMEVDRTDNTTTDVEQGRADVDPAVITEVERTLRRYLAARAEAGDRVDLGVCLSRDPVRASHEVASLLRISWPEVQDLLEAGAAPERLSHALALLARETELLRSFLGRKGTE